MKNTFFLREATLLDSITIADIYLESRKKLLAYAPLAHTDANIRNWVRDTLIPTGQVTVAERNGQILGMMALLTEQNLGWVEQLYILPTEISQGIGSALIELAKKTLGSPIQLYTFQENLIAKRFYERHGFKAILFRDGSENEENCPDILFRWQINS